MQPDKINQFNPINHFNQINKTNHFNQFNQINQEVQSGSRIGFVSLEKSMFGEDRKELTDL